MQVIDIKKLASSRYRVVISDGDHFEQAFVGGSCQHYFLNGMVQVHQLIRIKDFTIADINNTSVISLTDVEPSTSLKGLHGSPQKFEHSKSKPSEFKQAEAKMPAQKNNPVKNKENLEFTSVKTLTSSTKDFTIKARVTKKNEIKEWKNDRGSGKLFSINILDSFDAEISITFFKEDADKYFGIIEEGKVYIFKNGQVKLTNARFKSLENEYSICIDRRSEIIPCTDESEISSIKFHAISISSLADLPPNTMVDICAGIIDTGEVSEILSKKTNKLMKKRSLRLIDSSNSIVELTLWNDDAMSHIFDYPSLPIMLLGKGLRTSNFNGVTLTSDRNSSQLLYNPDLPETKQLKVWLGKNQGMAAARCLSIRASVGAAERVYRSFAEIKMESETGEKEESYLISGCIGFIRKDDPSFMFYQSCGNTEKCKKKVIKENNGLYRCESCQDNFERCDFKYILSIKMQDFSESLWVTAFDEVARLILGVTANQLHESFIENMEEFEDIIARSHMRRIEGVVKVRINETPQGRRPKYVLSTAKLPDVQKSLARNLGLISNYINSGN